MKDIIQVNEWLRRAVETEASDVHLSAGAPPSVRIYGSIVPVSEDEEKLTPEDTDSIARLLLTETGYSELIRKGDVDLSYAVPELGRFRVNMFRQRGSIGIAMRVLKYDIPSPKELGIPASVLDVTEKKRGLVLVTGVTGSGKSTTLASLIDIISRRDPIHVITLEDPIEYFHRHGAARVNQREIGKDAESFESGLRSALRQDPDVILVGEMRDLDTIATTVRAAETGHLVFSTLHTVDAKGTIDRIIDVFPANHQQQIRTQLADTLECIISQQLIPRADGKGRVAAFEVLRATTAVRFLIREGKSYQIPNLIKTNRANGMVPMDDSIYELLRKGIITRKEAVRYAVDKKMFLKRL